MSQTSLARPSQPGHICARGARANNLQSVDLDVPYRRLTTFCGLSGSGKSSMALDVLYAEGMRRYVECFSPNIRAKLEKIEKPDVDLVEGVPPAIAVTADDGAKPTRATLGDAVEALRALRSLFAYVGVPHCQRCGKPIRSESPDDVADSLLANYRGKRVMICFAPSIEDLQTQSQEEFEREWRELGFHRVVVNGSTYDLSDPAGIPSGVFRIAGLLMLADQTPSEDDVFNSIGLQRQNIPKKYVAGNDDDFDDDSEDSESQMENAEDSRTLMLAPDRDYSRIENYFSKRAEVKRKGGKPCVLFVVQRAKLDEDARANLVSGVATAYKFGDAQCWALVESDSQTSDPDSDDFTVVDDKPWKVVGFSRKLRCDKCGVDFPELTPNLFNYASPSGACDVCGGQGYLMAFDEDLVVPDKSRSIRNGAIAPWKTKPYRDELEAFLAIADDLRVRADAPYSELTREERGRLFNGSRRLNYPGLNGFFSALAKEKYKMHIRAFLARYQKPTKCLLCGGSRLRKEALSVEVGGRNLHYMLSSPIADALAALESLDATAFPPASRAACDAALHHARAKLRYLVRAGLGYLALDRPMKTLSSGERRRAALAKALSSDLVDMLFVLDEPTNGLHPSDAENALKLLLELRDRGNTLVVVDHNEAILNASDRIVEFGPEAGSKGGKIVFEGSASELRKSETLTGSYLSGKRLGGAAIRRSIKDKPMLRLDGATGYNLKNVSVAFPLGAFCVVTGVSGAGKSALVCDTLYPALCSRISADSRSADAVSLPYEALEGEQFLEEVAFIDQSPIGRSPRSNPVTFMKIFDDIRTLFAETPEAKARGYSAGYFSFNVDGGRCNVCKGEGFLQADMHFMSDVYARCPSCDGKRYQAPVLDILYRALNIAQTLDMTATEAFVHFRSQPKIQHKLKKMLDVGLGYLRLGQPANSLSGGESQRLKLAASLATARKGACLYILDEPTTGLHFADVVRLVDCLNEIVDSGASVIVIDHNPLLVKAADYVVDMGPGAGNAGGTIVATGTPEEIARRSDSKTGRYLAQLLATRQ